jgi:hypothetical protein
LTVANNGINPIQAEVLRNRFELGGGGEGKNAPPDMFLITNAIVTKLGTNMKEHKRNKMADFFNMSCDLMT